MNLLLEGLPALIFCNLAMTPRSVSLLMNQTRIYLHLRFVVGLLHLTMTERCPGRRPSRPARGMSYIAPGRYVSSASLSLVVAGSSLGGQFCPPPLNHKLKMSKYLGDFDNQKQILRSAHDEQLKYKSEQALRDKDYNR